MIRLLGRVILTLWNSFLVLSVTVVTPAFVYMWVSGGVAQSCAAKGMTCWSMSALMTAASISLFLSQLFYFSLLWTSHHSKDERFPFTRESLSYGTAALGGLRLAGKTYNALKGHTEFRFYRCFSWLVHRGGWLCMGVALGGLVPLLLNIGTA